MADPKVLGMAGGLRVGVTGTSIWLDEAGLLLGLSPEAEEVFGQQGNDCLRKHFGLLLRTEEDDDGVELTISALRDWCASGQLLVWKRTDGSACWFRGELGEATIDGPRSSLNMLSLAEASDEALARDIALLWDGFGNLLEGIPGGAIVVNEMGMIVLVNEEASRIFAMPSMTLQGASISALMPARMRARHSQDLSGFVRRQRKGVTEAWRGRRFGLRGDGAELELEVDLNALGRDGRLFVVCVVRDAEEWRQLRAIEDSVEVAQRASAAKTLFLTRMSHELRTPLNAVIGFSQLLEMDGGRNLSLEQQEYVRQIMKAGRHLLAMISDVMDISRIEAGAVVMTMEPVDISEAISEAISMASTAAKSRTVKVSFDVHSRHLFALADKLRLRQVLVNLISNGIKYNRDGGRVVVRASAVGKRLLIEVSDTGVGMSGEQVEHLYEPFNRLGAEHTSVEGNGMGLVITRSLVEKMGGELAAESEAGMGTTFRVLLDLTTSPVRANPEPQHDWSISKFGMERGRLRAVYVEDNHANRELLRSVMEMLPNWELVCVRTADEAIDEVRRERPDLLIVDMHLPDMHGVELVMRLETESSTASIPRVGLSADSMESSRMYAMSAGFARYFTKPLDIRSFMDFINKLADGSSGWSLAH